jgi:hypothetical protein
LNFLLAYIPYFEKKLKLPYDITFMSVCLDYPHINLQNNAYNTTIPSQQIPNIAGKPPNQDDTGPSAPKNVYSYNFNKYIVVAIITDDSTAQSLGLSRFLSSVIPYIFDRLLGRENGQSQGLYLYTGKYKQKKCTHRHRCLEWD